MGDDDHGHAGLGQILHEVEDLADHLGVQGGGGLVKEHDLGLHGQGSGDRDPLLLAAGKLDRVAVGLVREPDLFKQLHGELLGAGLVGLAQADGGQRDVLQDGLVGKEIEVLEDHAHFLAEQVDIGLGVIDHLSVDVDLALGRDLKHVETADQGALAGPGRPDDDHDLSLLDLQIDALQNFQVPEIFVKIFYADHIIPLYIC